MQRPGEYDGFPDDVYYRKPGYFVLAICFVLVFFQLAGLLIKVVLFGKEKS